MPIYEYRCASCGFQNEYLQRVSDPLLTDCPECGKATFKKMLTAAGFQLKGSGWYATDFKNKGSQPKADKDKDKTGEKGAEKGGEKAADKSADKPAETKKDDSKSESTASATPVSS
jgi:putative FmdB family regulatory protein